MLTQRCWTWIFAGWVCCGTAAYAQDSAAESAASPPPGSATVRTYEAPAPDFSEGAGDAQRPRSMLPQPSWKKTDDMAAAEMETEIAQLKRERSARINALALFEEEGRRLAEQREKTHSEENRKKIDYDLALVRFRIAGQNRAIRLINERLETLAAARVAQTQAEGPETREMSYVTAPENVEQVREAMQLLRQYDEALRTILQKGQVTEADVIYALGLLKEKEPILQAVETYLNDLQDYAQRKSTTPPEPPAQQVGG